MWESLGYAIEAGIEGLVRRQIRKPRPPVSVNMVIHGFYSIFLLISFTKKVNRDDLFIADAPFKTVGAKTKHVLTKIFFIFVTDVVVYGYEFERVHSYQTT